MTTIFSLQSHVVYGYVGNRVATFILQRLGFEVMTLNTVQFSNHTGYGAWSGDVFSKEHLEGIVDHLENVGHLQKCSALLTGYLGDPTTADLALKIRRMIPKEAMYVCDPVMGDVGRGFFVKEGILEKFQGDVIPHACAVTPNMFELEALSKMTVVDLDSLKRAITHLNRPLTLVTSVILPEIPKDQMGMILSVEGRFYLINTPMFKMNIPPNGAGDAVSALFLGYMLKNRDSLVAFKQVATAMHHLFEATYRSGERELALISSQDAWSQGEILFDVSEV